jgi:hypothetical protein
MIIAVNKQIHPISILGEKSISRKIALTNLVFGFSAKESTNKSFC